MDRSAIEFWQTGNLALFVAYPILYVVVAVAWRNLFLIPFEAPLHVLSAIGGGQCLLLTVMPTRAAFEIYCATMLIALVVEITVPSRVHNQIPAYNDRQRLGYGVLHAWAWTCFAFGIEKLFVSLVCTATVN